MSAAFDNLDNAELDRVASRNDENAQPLNGGAGTGTWTEPDLSVLNDRRGHLPDLPILVFTSPWQDWITRSAHGAGVTPAHVAVPLLAVTSSLIGTARRIRPSRSWSEPMTLWAAIVGSSGSGKTPGIHVVRRVLSRIDRDRKGKAVELQRQHETRAQTAKAIIKQWKEEVQAAIADNLPPPPMPANAIDPGPFIAPRLYASDATIERLAVLLQARPCGMTMICDELAGLFRNMGRYSGGSDREFWLEAWNGQHYVVERQGRPPVVLDHLLIGICGGFQPDKLSTSLKGDSDGMHARLIFAWPEEPAYRPLSNEVSEIEPEILNAFARILDLPAEEEGVFAPRDIPLSDDAVEQFEEFRQFLHAEKAVLDGREREWWAKGAAHVLRLAGTFCYLDWSMAGGPEPTEVSDSHMQSAVWLWEKYLWPHARAALRQIGLSDRHAHSRRVLNWIRVSGKREISREDIRRDALGQALNAEETQKVIDALINAGWLRSKLDANSVGPGRKVRRWQVNPILWS